MALLCMASIFHRISFMECINWNHIWRCDTLHSSIFSNKIIWKCWWIFIIRLSGFAYCKYSQDIILVNKIRVHFNWYFNWYLICFRFGRQFELPLLIQSIVMSICMLVMIELCVRIKRQSMIIPNKSRTFLGIIFILFINWLLDLFINWLLDLFTL